MVRSFAKYYKALEKTRSPSPSDVRLALELKQKLGGGRGRQHCAAGQIDNRNIDMTGMHSTFVLVSTNAGAVYN
jgi:hypothetical protein